MEQEIYNFSAGPSVLPEPVLKKAKEEFTNYRGIGYSIIEASHRGKDFEMIHNECKSRFKKLMGLGDDYKVLLLHGGASTAFFQIPMNLLSPGKKADYIDSGSWTSKAFKEAKFFGSPVLTASSKDKNYTELPENPEKNFSSDAVYRYMCSNNTIFGTQWKEIPRSPDAPLVCDMSSDILSMKRDFSKFGIIFGGVQKNLAPAAMAFVVIRGDVLNMCKEELPSMCSYKLQAEKDAMFNTPPVFSTYMMNYTLEWIESMGGLDAIETHNKKKAEMIYSILDENDYYKPVVTKKDHRSMMNITFTLADDSATATFLEKAEEKGFTKLKGHRSIGGLRASVYNAFPMKGVEKFCDFLKDFAQNRS